MLGISVIRLGSTHQQGTTSNQGHDCGLVRLRHKSECLSLEWFRSRAEAKVVIETWRRHYNEVRPHSSLGYLTPAEFAVKIEEQDAASRSATGRIAAVCGASALRPVASPSRKGHAKAEMEVVASS